MKELDIYAIRARVAAVDDQIRRWPTKVRSQTEFDRAALLAEVDRLRDEVDRLRFENERYCQM